MSQEGFLIQVGCHIRSLKQNNGKAKAVWDKIARDLKVLEQNQRELTKAFELVELAGATVQRISRRTD